MLLVSALTGSYGLAGQVSAAYVVGNALFAIPHGRLADRFGQGRVLYADSVVVRAAVGADDRLDHRRAGPSAWPHVWRRARRCRDPADRHRWSGRAGRTCSRATASGTPRSPLESGRRRGRLRHRPGPGDLPRPPPGRRRPGWCWPWSSARSAPSRWPSSAAPSRRRTPQRHGDGAEPDAVADCWCRWRSVPSRWAACSGRSRWPRSPSPTTQGTRPSPGRCSALLAGQPAGRRRRRRDRLAQRAAARAAGRLGPPGRRHGLRCPFLPAWSVVTAGALFLDRPGARPDADRAVLADRATVPRSRLNEGDGDSCRPASAPASHRAPWLAGRGRRRARRCRRRTGVIVSAVLAALAGSLRRDCAARPTRTPREPPRLPRANLRAWRRGRNWSGLAPPTRPGAQPARRRRGRRRRVAARHQNLTVKMPGTGHSLHRHRGHRRAAAAARRLRGIVGVDHDAMTVTALAGTPLHELNRALERLGLSLHNMGDIDEQTVAGAISTGTHGTGGRRGLAERPGGRAGAGHRRRRAARAPTPRRTPTSSTSPGSASAPSGS